MLLMTGASAAVPSSELSEHKGGYYADVGQVYTLRSFAPKTSCHSQQHCARNMNFQVRLRSNKLDMLRTLALLVSTLVAIATAHAIDT